MSVRPGVLRPFVGRPLFVLAPEHSHPSCDDSGSMLGEFADKASKYAHADEHVADGEQSAELRRRMQVAKPTVARVTTQKYNASTGVQCSRNM